SALITKDGKYLVFGDVFVASRTVQNNPSANAPATDQKIVNYVRTKFHVPDAVKLTVGPFQDSEYSAFYQTTIYGQEGEKKSSTLAFLTKDGRYMVIGSVFNLSVDPKKEVEQTINLNDQPTVGPANAPVTIVEFADLECPMCAETQKFIEDKLIPKYGNKIRVVFKEFPLVTIHDWALTAAIANECAYKLSPADYARYRTTIFAGQEMINAANVRTLLLDFGQRSGLKGIVSTPTLFINGTPVVGLNVKRIYQLVDEGLQKAASR
ncbi:MAG: thioredoxin domain-containing protein, partial [Acidobacteriota bacterium]